MPNSAMNVARQRGGALVAVVLVVGLMLVTTAGMLSFMIARSHASADRVRFEEAGRACDAALGLKLAQLMRFEDEGIAGAFADQTRYAVSVRVHPQGDLFKITVATRLRDARHPHLVEAVVERVIASASSEFRGAVMARQAISLSGSSLVNGNNHDLALQPVGLGFGPTSAHDQVAVASTKNITVNGGAKVMGGGDPSSQNRGDPGPDGDYAVLDPGQNLHPFVAYGQTAGDHFPTTPDQVLSSPDGTAKQRAMDSGTYFASLSEFEAWAGALPGHAVPPSSILYLDFGVPAPGMDLGSNLRWGTTYHTVIQHHPTTAEVLHPQGGTAGAPLTAYVDFDEDGSPDSFLDPAATGAPVFDGFGYVKTEPDGDSVVKALHGQFFGVLVCDDLANMNAGAEIVGGVCSLQADDGTVQSFCNGKARVTYSAPAIDRAIAANLYTGVSYRIKSYRLHPRTRDAEFVASRVGASLTISEVPEDAVSEGDVTRTTDGWFEPRFPTVDQGGE